MSTTLLDKLKGVSVTPHGFYWKFHTESAGESILTLTPSTFTDLMMVVGLLKTPTGCLFVKLSSVYSITNLSVEDLENLRIVINNALKEVDCEMISLGGCIKLVRRKVGVYILAIDKQPIAAIETQSTIVPVEGGRRKNVYDVKSYVDLPKDDVYSLVESVNGQRGIALGIPKVDQLTFC